MVTPLESSVREAQRRARRTAREASPWIVGLGRLGYAAKGLVYLIIGTLAAQAAAGAGGAITDPHGALGWVVDAPRGRLLLAIMAIGLAGYALWCVLQGFLDTEAKGTSAKGLVARGGFVATGLVTATFALAATHLVLDPGGDGSAGPRDWTAWLLAQPFGQWLVGIVGLVVLSSGLYHLYKAGTANFRADLKLHEMSREQEDLATRIGRFGFAAHGVAVGIMGGFLVVAAAQAREQEVRGLSGALETLAQQPDGPWLLGSVAVGLIAYGAFQLVEARYRRMVIR